MRVLVFAGLLACGSGTEPVPADLPAIDETSLTEATRRMTDIGHRMVAMPGEDRAYDEIVDWLLDAGLEPTADPFVFDAWRPGTATIEAGGQSFEAHAMSPSPPTDVTGPLQLQGDAGPGDIGLFSSADGARAEQFLYAGAAGVDAWVRISDFTDHDGSPLVEVGHTLVGSDLAGAGVDQPTGDALRGVVGQEVRLRIDPDIAYGHESKNVVVRLGDPEATRRIWITAHYDSWYNSEGAFDNALGVGAWMLLARRAASFDITGVEVVFLATSGEEQGLQGSFAWVEEREHLIGPSDLAVTLDVLWSAEGDFICMGSTEERLQAAVEAHEAEGLAVVEGGDPGVASDHFPFVSRGAQAIWCGRWPDRHYHTTEDRLEYLDLGEATKVVQAHWNLLAREAGLDDAAAPATTP